jgi:protein TonB
MLNPDRLRVAAALLVSLGVHLLVMGLDLGGESRPPVAGPARQVKVRLVARRVPVTVPVMAAPARNRTRATAVAPPPPLLPPVAVAVREIPAVVPPPAPLVPELPIRAAAAADAPVKPPVAEVGEVDDSLPPATVRARPRYRENPPPPYPGPARRRHLQGTVVLEVAVGPDGEVEQLLIQATSGHEILDRAALAAVKDWLFEPGQRGGHRVAMKVLVPVRFSLR